MKKNKNLKLINQTCATKYNCKYINCLLVVFFSYFCVMNKVQTNYDLFLIEFGSNFEIFGTNTRPSLLSF